MLSVSVVIAQGISVLICFAIPILGFIMLRKHYGGIIRPFLVGMLCFFVSQILLRIPIISLVLPSMLWFHMLNLYPVVYAAFMGFTAGIFEEVGRFLFITHLLKKNRRYKDAIAFGVGHAGIEAVLITGISATMSFFYSILLRHDLAPNLVANAQVYSSIMSMTATDGLMTGVERIAALGIHIGLTVMVFEGINRKKPFLFLAAAIIIHGAVDMLSVLLYNVLGLNVLIVEGVLLFCAAILIWYAIKAKDRFSERKIDTTEDTEVNEK